MTSESNTPCAYIYPEGHEKAGQHCKSTILVDGSDMCYHHDPVAYPDAPRNEPSPVEKALAAGDEIDDTLKRMAFRLNAALDALDQMEGSNLDVINTQLKVSKQVAKLEELMQSRQDDDEELEIVYVNDWRGRNNDAD